MGLFDQYKTDAIEQSKEEKKEGQEPLFEYEVSILQFKTEYFAYFYSTNFVFPHKYNRHISQLGYFQRLLQENGLLYYEFHSSCPRNSVTDYLNQLTIANLEASFPTFSQEGKLYNKKPIVLGQPPYMGIESIYYLMGLSNEQFIKATKNRKAVRKHYQKKRDNTSNYQGRII
jgi:hypothetical protein